MRINMGGTLLFDMRVPYAPKFDECASSKQRSTQCYAKSERRWFRKTSNCWKRRRRTQWR